MLDPHLTIATAAHRPAPLVSDRQSDELDTLLANIRRHAQAVGQAYAGGVNPVEAWELVSAGRAVLIDVRTHEERTFVGLVPGSLHVAWMTGTALTRNPRFVKELETKAKKDAVLLFLCRSGKRSIAAAEAATKAGFQNAFNVLEGFEGDLDANNRRGHLGGWRLHGLPWIQD